MTSNIGSHRILEYRGAFAGEEYRHMKEAVFVRIAAGIPSGILEPVGRDYRFPCFKRGALEANRRNSACRLAGPSGGAAHHISAVGCGPYYASTKRVRSELRRAAIETGDPERNRKSAGENDSGRRSAETVKPSGSIRDSDGDGLTFKVENKKAAETEADSGLALDRGVNRILILCVKVWRAAGVRLRRTKKGF